jgi:CDP-diacylglycerol--glycerol-3-phosphate 3-phosphatidyltransferase
MNLPNSITLGRLVLTGVFIAAASAGGVAGHWIALVSFVLAAASDFLDGWLARRLGMVTPIGKLMDPLADKILTGSAFVHLSVEGLCPAWVSILIIAREFLVTGLRQLAVEAGQVLAADHLGKWKTTMQLAFCIICLIWFASGTVAPGNSVIDFLRRLSAPGGWLQPVFLWLAFALTLLSGFHYLWGSRRLLSSR